MSCFSDKSKPAIAHRDFNSRNIMVTEDNTCVVVDFGFAMRIDGCHFYRNGQETNAEQTSLSDVSLDLVSLNVLPFRSCMLSDCRAQRIHVQCCTS